MKNQELEDLIKNSTHRITDENQDKWEVIELSDLEEIIKIARGEAKEKVYVMNRSEFDQSDDGNGGFILMADCPNCGDAVVYGDGCVKCDAMFNFIDDLSQRQSHEGKKPEKEHNTQDNGSHCKQCKKPLPDGLRWCSSECKQGYYL